MKKYWVITRGDDGCFVAFPSDEEMLERVIGIATCMDDDATKKYWVAEQITYCNIPLSCS